MRLNSANNFVRLHLYVEEEAGQWFGCDHASPFMLYTHLVKTDALAAVTHVNGTARIQTVSSASNRRFVRVALHSRHAPDTGFCATPL